ncbi:LOW QUALITY PROTEIN: zinc finger CCCH domain-containing protein 3 [Xyrichtys novacula]|uniref:Zinc finger CCCH domain-containing protein 3 n=1 Tax=Xyrichtys novacula TaxID=13765 RepID=A0AAV1FFU0_XYRNO|nr:LOW QUALITY PROTEIN: zinc finger CCCH domain-containing protein 3 [Xyrichtys novacula]
MEEREALKRQIELLQNLINTHKSVHGDVPFSRAEQRPPGASTLARGRGVGSSVVHPHSSRGIVYDPQSRGSWRKTYSLSNKTPQTSVGHPSASTSSSGHQSSSTGAPHSTPQPGHSREEETDGARIMASSSDRNSGLSAATTEERKTSTLRKTTGSQHEGEKPGSGSTGVEKLHRQTQESQQKPHHRLVVLPSSEKKISVPSSAQANTSTSLHKSPPKPLLSSKTSMEAKKTTTFKAPVALPTGHNVLPLSKTSKQPSVKPTPHPSHCQAAASSLKQSKFTWVKSQNVGKTEPKQASPVPTVSTTLLSKAGVVGGSASSSLTSKRTPAKKLTRKLSPVTVASKTSKYRWVSSSVGAVAKIPRKSPSPKALVLSQRALEKGEPTKKVKSPSTPFSKLKKGNASSSSNSSTSSRYRWKAGGQSSPGAAAAGAATATRRKSAFHWTSDRSYRSAKGGFVSPPSQRTSLTPSPGGFKLRSRMKIIRKTTPGGGGSEKGSSPSAVKFSPRARIHSFTRTPTGVKRTPSKELVSFGRHKLRRLSPTSSRTSLAASPSSQRVFRTRYKMVTRPGSSAAHTPHYNPALSWRTKRIQSARSFLQSRLRTPPPDRQPSSAQRWRGSSMCWIGGSLYRVSANKLSRTVGSNMSINRTGRSFSGAQVSFTSPTYSRPFSTRHLASRAVQRSLAIIRHARHKKPQQRQKQYCMYYNRFGKCNRGNSCPFIHDPDKVAVCTRFLRGTCKQADGTCPFSHKVAKEKMPVCSYFLKGICNNSDCPYSHVYVSRNAKVCEDFVKGYCPEGAKCKKKHTLVCPDFSKTGTCPRGASCKLQHRQRVKRSPSTSSANPTRRGRAREPSKRPRLSVLIPQSSQTGPGRPSAGSLELPSFISLSSSPEEADAPDTPDTPDTLTAESAQVKEKKLQIKPRL